MSCSWLWIACWHWWSVWSVRTVNTVGQDKRGVVSRPCHETEAHWIVMETPRRKHINILNKCREWVADDNWEKYLQDRNHQVTWMDTWIRRSITTLTSSNIIQRSYRSTHTHSRETTSCLAHSHAHEDEFYKTMTYIFTQHWIMIPSHCIRLRASFVNPYLNAEWPQWLTRTSDTIHGWCKVL